MAYTYCNQCGHRNPPESNFCSSCGSALDVLDASPIGVVLVDRAMPGPDGLWLLEQIRARFPNIAMILATGDDSIPSRFTKFSSALSDGAK